jgi:hypothetical protein
MISHGDLARHARHRDRRLQRWRKRTAGHFAVTLVRYHPLMGAQNTAAEQLETDHSAARLRIFQQALK